MAGIAKYHTVRQQLEAMIQSGIFDEGKLPSEPKLAERLGVSRSVIRQAYDELQKQGIIERKAGLGTIVRCQLPKKDRIISMMDQIRDAGMEPSTSVLAAERIPASDADEWVREAFHLAAGVVSTTPLYRIDRLRCGDGRPLARQILYLLAEQFPDDLLETADFARSLFALYAEHDRFPARVEESIEARWATPEEIKLLRMSRLPAKERLVYVRRRTTWDFQGHVLEVLHSADRWDFFRSYRYAIQGANQAELVARPDVDGQGATDE